MSRKTMSVLLRIILLVLVTLGLLFFFAFLPFYGAEMAQVNPEYEWAYIPCLVWAWVFALPLFIAAVPIWRIFGTIRKKGEAFSSKNAKRFLIIAALFCCSGFLFVGGMLAVAWMGAGSAPLTLVIAPMVFLITNTAGFLCYVLSRLVQESAEIREENELTV